MKSYIQKQAKHKVGQNLNIEKENEKDFLNDFQILQISTKRSEIKNMFIEGLRNFENFTEINAYKYLCINPDFSPYSNFSKNFR